MALIDVMSYHSVLHRENIAAKPYRHDPWLWVTQGVLLMAVRDDGSDADPTPEKLGKALFYVEASPREGQVVALAALRAFAGPPAPADVTCKGCGGDGRDSSYGETVECEHCGAQTRMFCSVCGGDGVDASLPTREARVSGIPVNLSLLAFALAQAPTAPAEVTIGSLKTEAMKEGAALVVVADDWRIVLMGLREHGHKVSSFPETALEAAKGSVAVDPSAHVLER